MINLTGILNFGQSPATLISQQNPQKPIEERTDYGCVVACVDHPKQF